MTIKKLLSLCCAALALSASAQQFTFATARFHTGDDPQWKATGFDDSSWQELSTSLFWNQQGISQNGYAWYRIKFTLPATPDKGAKQYAIYIDNIDDCDETFFNGALVGKTGAFPTDQGGYQSQWNTPRRYAVPASSPLLKWGKENVIAVRVYNGNGQGGIVSKPLQFKPITNIDAITVESLSRAQYGSKQGTFGIRITNGLKTSQKNKVHFKIIDQSTGQILGESTKKASIKGGGNEMLATTYPSDRSVDITVTCTDESNYSRTFHFTPQYILTPKAPEAPRFNGPEVFGVRPGSPVIFRLPVSGQRPMKFTASRLPQGITLNDTTGVLSGSVKEAGTYEVTFTAANAKGKVSRNILITVGPTIGLTPPMGWNSWNCWGKSVSQEKVMASAKALLSKGLADYGYSYVNIDDAWESSTRDAQGYISTNEKFSNMKGLGDWLHGNGLKLGIYSSPGDGTCGGYLGSLGYEEQDAKRFNEWGVDYLKYDWCGYFKEFDKEKPYDPSTASYMRPYLYMEKFLRQQPRDIFYSLCQYGMDDVWKWGAFIDANSWRTTGDIQDTWESMSTIGFKQQAALYPYASPGHWNDPDMLVVGKVGWGPKLHDTRLNADEQYTHISLWSLLAANMLIGCDIAQIDDFTLNLLCNNEVVAINQDKLGKQARPVAIEGDLQIWARPLSDGSVAVGVFNLGDKTLAVSPADYMKAFNLPSISTLRDLWRQQDLPGISEKLAIPPHGVKLLKAIK